MSKMLIPELQRHYWSACGNRGLTQSPAGGEYQLCEMTHLGNVQLVPSVLQKM